VWVTKKRFTFIFLPKLRQTYNNFNNSFTDVLSTELSRKLVLFYGPRCIFSSILHMLDKGFWRKATDMKEMLQIIHTRWFRKVTKEEFCRQINLMWEVRDKKLQLLDIYIYTISDTHIVSFLCYWREKNKVGRPNREWADDFVLYDTILCKR